MLLRLFDADVLMSISLAASGRIVQAYISMVQSEAICKPDGKLGNVTFRRNECK